MSGSLYTRPTDVNRQSAQGTPGLDDTLVKPAAMRPARPKLASRHPATINASEVPRQSGLTLWRQIAETLRQEMGGDEYPPGARLSTEAELSARFSVNRHTVRRALEELS